MQFSTHLGSTLAAGVAALAVAAPAAAQVLDFNFKVNQGSSPSFATLSLTPTMSGTEFDFSTLVSGGQGNPGVVELLFGCNGCGTPTFTEGAGVDIQTGGFTQAGYTFDFRAVFDPEATASSPRTWTATGLPGTFLESTDGAGPPAFALIQLTGGTQTLGGENIESGFYVAAVPEPETYAMLLAGLGLLGFMLRRRT